MVEKTLDEFQRKQADAAAQLKSILENSKMCLQGLQEGMKPLDVNNVVGAAGFAVLAITMGFTVGV